MVAAVPETPSSRRWLALATVGLAQLMIVLDISVVNIALPAAQADLGFSTGDRQWVITAYSLAFGSLLLLGGRLSDLIGRRRTFVIGLVGFAAASALGGAAGSFGLLVTARALQGVFGALLAPTALALLTTTFTVPRERARAFGVFGAIAGAGGAIGLLLGGVLTEAIDWRWSLYINVVIAALAIVGTVLFLGDAARTGARPRLDVLSTLLGSAAVFGLVYGSSNVESEGWGSPLSWGVLAGAVLVLAAFVLRQVRAEQPLLPLGILLDRNRGAAYSAILIAGSGMFGIFLFVTFYLQATLGFTPIQTGVSFLPMVAMLVLAAQVGTNLLLPRFGPKVLVPIGMTLAAAGLLYLTRVGVDSSYAADVLPGLMAIGLGMGTLMPASIQTATLGVQPAFAGVASALVNTSQQVGGSIGTAVLNTLAASVATGYLAANQPATDATLGQAAVQSYVTAFGWAAGFFAVGAVLTALLFRRRVADAPAVPSAAAPEAVEPAVV
jgi:EmrB/QacA subfamily drug resistance transporter